MREGWEYRKLGDFIEEYSERDKGKGFPVFSVTNSQGFCQEYFDKNVASKDTSNYKVVPFGCFAYNPSRINVGSVALQNQIDFVSVSPLYVVFTVSEELKQDFLLYFLKSSYCMTYINAYSRGAVRNNLRLSTLKTFDIPYYSIDKQQRIVEELDLLSSIIEKKKAQLKELDSLAQSIFYDMFGDPVTNEKRWEVKKLENIIIVIGGYAFKSSNFKEKGIPVLRIGNINSGVFKNSSMVFWERDDKLHKYLMHPGDLVMSLTGTVGKSDYGNICLLDNSYKEYYLNQRNAQLKLKENVDKYYLSSILRFDTVKSKLTDVSRGVRQANISNKDIENLQIPLPPLPLQQQFAEKVEAIEHQKELIKQSIKEVETLFNSRMDYYFN